VSGLNEEPMKPDSEQNDSLLSLIALVTKLVEQNSVLIQQSSEKEKIILRLLDQHDEILNELVEQQDDDEQTGSTFLDG
jgi:aminopeptidase C